MLAIGLSLCLLLCVNIHTHTHTHSFMYMYTHTNFSDTSVYMYIYMSFSVPILMTFINSMMCVVLNIFSTSEMIIWLILFKCMIMVTSIKIFPDIKLSWNKFHLVIVYDPLMWHVFQLVALLVIFMIFVSN